MNFFGKPLLYYVYCWRPLAAFLTHTGIAFFGGIGNRPSVTSVVSGSVRRLLSGLGGAYCISIAAANSSARSSIISSKSSFNFLRQLAMRFSRVRRNSAIRPWCAEDRYSIMRRSRSSAVAGFRTARSLNYSVVLALNIAAANFRSIPGQILCWIDEGVKRENVESCGLAGPKVVRSGDTLRAGAL